MFSISAVKMLRIFWNLNVFNQSVLPVVIIISLLTVVCIVNVITSLLQLRPGISSPLGHLQIVLAWHWTIVTKALVVIGVDWGIYSKFWKFNCVGYLAVNWFISYLSNFLTNVFWFELDTAKKLAIDTSNYEKKFCMVSYFCK